MNWVDWDGTRRDYDRVQDVCVDETTPLERCTICGDLVPAGMPVSCRRCRRRYPWPLLKAMYDPFDYALGLANGLIIRFSECVIEGPWITLRLSGEQPAGSPPLPFPCARGVTLHLDQILWVADAPEGS